MKAVQKQVTILDRTEIKRNGVILYMILSSDNVTKYFITLSNGKVDEATHQDCEGFHFHGHCYHVDYILQVEAMSQYDVNAVADRVVADALIGDAYEVMAAEKVQSIEAVRKSGLAESYDPKWYPNTAA